MNAIAAGALPRPVVQAKAISIVASAAVAFGVVLLGFVVNEPAPYELFMVALIALWGLFGLRISGHAAILLALLVAYNVGGLLSMWTMGDLYETPLYLAVTLFLSLTAVFFAAIIEADHRRYALIFNAWAVAALATGALGIAGYFNLFPGSDLFVRFDRAKGAFEDPNVFGPFLALPAIYALSRVLAGNALHLPVHAATFIFLVAAILLSFSRGAWALFVVSALLLVTGLLLQSSSGRMRLRIVLMSVIAVALLAAAILVALQLPGVAEFFAQRAKLVQDYDTGEYGRFGRFALGFRMAAEYPLGIGPLNFGRFLGEDTHNIWLKALMDYGWLGFAAFVALVAFTIAGGLRILFRDRPWQPYLLCAYVVFVGHVGLGTVIDMDHWRHFYVLLGLIWGAMGLELRHQRNLQVGRHPAIAAGPPRPA